MRIETMHKGKTDQSYNGYLKKTCKHPWKEYRRVWVPELRLWLLIKKSLKPSEVKEKVDNFVRKYKLSLPYLYKKSD